MIYPVKVMLVVCMRGQEKGVPCVGCFSCAFGSFFRIRFSYKKTQKHNVVKDMLVERPTHTLTHSQRDAHHNTPLPYRRRSNISPNARF